MERDGLKCLGMFHHHAIAKLLHDYIITDTQQRLARSSPCTFGFLLTFQHFQVKRSCLTCLVIRWLHMHDLLVFGR